MLELKSAGKDPPLLRLTILILVLVLENSVSLFRGRERRTRTSGKTSGAHTPLPPHSLAVLPFHA